MTCLIVLSLPAASIACRINSTDHESAAYNKSFSLGEPGDVVGQQRFEFPPAEFLAELLAAPRGVIIGKPHAPLRRGTQHLSISDFSRSSDEGTVAGSRSLRTTISTLHGAVASHDSRDRPPGGAFFAVSGPTRPSNTKTRQEAGFHMIIRPINRTV